MIVAFHFAIGSDAGYYGWRIQRQFFQYLLAAPREDIHVEIFEGDLLTDRYTTDEHARETLLQGLSGFDPRRWSTVDPEEFAAALLSNRIYVLAVEGLPSSIQDHLDAQLRRDTSYLGALKINPGNPVDWDLYRRSLVPRYRYINGDSARPASPQNGGTIENTQAIAAHESPRTNKLLRPHQRRLHIR